MHKKNIFFGKGKEKTFFFMCSFNTGIQAAVQKNTSLQFYTLLCSSLSHLAFLGTTPDPLKIVQHGLQPAGKTRMVSSKAM